MPAKHSKASESVAKSKSHDIGLSPHGTGLPTHNTGQPPHETGLPTHDTRLPSHPVSLPRDFFTRDGITLARELLGKILVHETPVGTVRGFITEVESYMGEQDKGSHTYGGKRTERTEPMYHIGGTSYVYLIYGMYSCMNIAAMTDGIPQAVLLRSVIPVDSESGARMIQLRLEQLNRKQVKRNLQPYTPETCPSSLKKHLADGPGKLCIAMGITRRDNDVDMVESGSFYVTEGVAVAPEKIKAGKRIGIDYAEEAADYLWRFYIDELNLGRENK